MAATQFPNSSLIVLIFTILPLFFTLVLFFFLQLATSSSNSPKRHASLDRNPKLRIVVLSGSGDHFCSGIDMDEGSLGFSNSKNIFVSGLSSLNSQMFHIVFSGCENVKVQGVKVTAAGNSPNTDGIHVEKSRSVTIVNSKIGIGDDCISIGPGTNNLWIGNIACGPGHGISVGSLGKNAQEAGVENVTVSTVAFSGTQNGVRIKSWARLSTGFAKNIIFQHVVMNNVQNPIIIDQNYCPDNEGCPNKESGVKITDITYQDIHGTSTTQVEVKFDCSSTDPCNGITLEDVKLTYKNQVAQASCANAGGTVSGYVQPSSCL